MLSNAYLVFTCKIQCRYSRKRATFCRNLAKIFKTFCQKLARSARSTSAQSGALPAQSRRLGSRPQKRVWFRMIIVRCRTATAAGGAPRKRRRRKHPVSGGRRICGPRARAPRLDRPRAPAAPKSIGCIIGCTVHLIDTPNRLYRSQILQENLISV